MPVDSIPSTYRETFFADTNAPPGTWENFKGRFESNEIFPLIGEIEDNLISGKNEDGSNGICTFATFNKKKSFRLREKINKDRTLN